MTPQLVKDLTRDFKDQPAKLREAKLKQKEKSDRLDLIRETVSSFVSADKAIYSAQMVSNALMNSHGVEVSTIEVRRLLKNEFELSFKRARKLSSSVNSDKNLVVRQQYALQMM